jgi:Xaa-Pro aminopeptidase
MLNDLDQQMAARNVDAIVVIGDTTLANPDLTYVVGGSLPRGGIYMKRVNHEPLLITSNLDIGTARKHRTIKQIKTYTEQGLEKLTLKHGRSDAYPHLIKAALTKLGAGSRVAIYGRNDLSGGIYLADQLRKLEVNVIGEPTPTILESARETKSDKELALLREVGTRTGRVVESVANCLRRIQLKRGRLMLGKQRATVGIIKEIIAITIAAEGLVAPEGTIFAPGPSSADPHDVGNPTHPLKPGQLIVFDIFPQDETSGYWSDLTRTFVVGRADGKAKKQYEAVKEAQLTALDAMKDSASCKEVTLKSCDVIEKHGYRTLRNLAFGKPANISSGFIHSLGHGVGLTIGERPYLSLLRTEQLRRREVVTVEPGVYLPGYGGVRIEDTVAITKNGVNKLSPLGEYELEVT